jgi:hypothetical protein
LTPITRADEPRPELGSAGAEGDALMVAVGAALPALKKLFEHRQLIEPGALRAVEETLEGVEGRLARNELCVVVIGERQSGKSTLLDAIVGDRLLGGARGQIGVVTFIRRGESPSYLARFKSGATEDFSRRVPDLGPEFAERTGQLEQSLEATKRRCTAARSEFRRAIEARESADQAVTEARRGLDAETEAARTTANQLVEVEDEARRVDTALAEVEPDVPQALRRPPPRWALWLWFLYFVFSFVKRRVLTRYRALSIERSAIDSRLVTGRTQAEEHSKAKADAGARLAGFDAARDAQKTAASNAEKELRAAEHERDEARAKLDELGSEREHRDADRRRRFFADLKSLSGDRPGWQLVELSIAYPARLLPADVAIIDMPGAFSESGPEWTAIRGRVDGCILVSELDRGVSESAKGFVRQLKGSVPHLLLVLTKVDKAFADAVHRGGDDPWDQVEHARRIGTRRFARELGREPDSVLSIAVAAEIALRPEDSELARRFEAEIAKLFQLLRHERAIILGAHAGGAVRRCIGGLFDAEQRAESVYRETIDDLERKRTPAPEAFSRAEIEAARPAVEAAAQRAIDGAVQAAESGFAGLRRIAAGHVDTCPSRRRLVEVAARLSKELAEQTAAVRRQANLELEAGIERAVDDVCTTLFEGLRRRYQLLHKVERASSSSPRLGAPSETVPDFPSFAGDVERAVDAFDKGRYALGVSGMVAGGTAGVVWSPWLGAAGAALGALSAFARREGALRERVVGIFTAALAEKEREYAEELRSSVGDTASAIHGACERALERAILRFGKWIAEPIEAEQVAIDATRQKLASLEALRRELAEHDADLERLLKAAADASVGLCR